jgi:N-acetylglucosaminyldiphosphoundecaprenol N-acetyl-beta-D-mannosaminyltransferase
MSTAVDTIQGWISSGHRDYVCVTGVHGVMECQRDPELARIHNRAGLVTPDGMPLVWLAHAAGREHVGRVYGPDLMLAVCRRSLETGWRHFLYGGAEGVPELLARRLSERFEGLRIVGMHSPPFRPPTPAEDEAIVAEINRSEADIVWVGLSTPKQERWMAAHVGRLEAGALIGVGAAFDFHAGLKSQAPDWMRRSGLEWLYRLLQEPRRLAPRYLRNNPAFVAALAARKLGLRARTARGASP